MNVRKLLFWCHLTVGSIAGVVILTMCVTGVLLAFERQIISFAERDFRVSAPADGHRLPLESLLEKAHAANPTSAPMSIAWKSDPSAPVEVAVNRNQSLLLNPYSGVVLGEGAKRTRAFFHSVEDIHRWLAASPENRATGRAITGACNLGFSAPRLLRTVPVASANLVARRSPRRHAAEIFAPWQSPRFQLAQRDRHLDLRPARRHRALRRRDVLPVGQQSRLQNDGQHAASAECATARLRESAAERPAKSQSRRVVNRVRQKRKRIAMERPRRSKPSRRRARPRLAHHHRSIRFAVRPKRRLLRSTPATAAAPTNARNSLSTAKPAPKSAGNLSRATTPAANCAPGSVSRTPEKPAACSANPSPRSLPPVAQCLPLPA